MRASPCLLAYLFLVAIGCRAKGPSKAAGSSIDALAPCSGFRQQPCTTLQGVLRRLPRERSAKNLISRSRKVLSPPLFPISYS